MRVKVNNNDLEELLKSMVKNREDLRTYLKELMGQINVLKEVWQGEDAEVFYHKAETYLKFLESVPNYYNNLDNLIGSASKSYRAIDSEYAQRMKKAVVEHE